MPSLGVRVTAALLPEVARASLCIDLSASSFEPKVVRLAQTRSGAKPCPAGMRRLVVERRSAALTRLLGHQPSVAVGGIMTVLYCAVKLNRAGYGIELNPLYWRDGVAHVQSIALKAAAPTLFDVADPAASNDDDEDLAA